MPHIDVTANNVNFSELHKRMQWYVDQELLPCVSTLVMRGLDVLDYHCVGYMDIHSRAPLREDAIYRMFSNTKLLTSVAMMQLFEQGKFQLDDALHDYIPVFANPRVLVDGATSIEQTEAARSPVSIRHLLSHSAGFSYSFIEPESVLDAAYLGNGLDVIGGFRGNLEDLMLKLAEFPLAFQPGTGFRYGLSTDIVARLIEIISGQSFDVYLRDHVLAPLGMGDTGFCVPQDKLDRLTALSAPSDILQPTVGGLTQLAAAGVGPSTNPRWISGGGGLYSTMADYLSFVRMLVNGGEWQGERILKTQTLDLMRSNQLHEGVAVNFPEWHMPGTVFGLGFALRVNPGAQEPAAAVGEYHWGGLAGTHSWMSPAGVSGLCMTQLMPSFWHPYSHDFKRLAYQLAG